MDLKNIYKKSYDFLVGEAVQYGITEDMIDSFISTSDMSECNTIQSAYKQLLVTMQDFYSYKNVIGYKTHKEQINGILHDCDVRYISALNPEILLNEFRIEFHFQRDDMWRKYCKSLISGAIFMSRFQNDEEFVNTLNHFDKDDMTREAFALLLSRKIYNMGFAVACNWMKELGYLKYAKPDIHTKDICMAFGLVSRKDDLECFEAIAKTAKAAGVEAYSLDKVWWLICTGDFYRFNLKLPDPKDRKVRFLEILK